VLLQQRHLLWNQRNNMATTPTTPIEEQKSVTPPAPDRKTAIADAVKAADAVVVEEKPKEEKPKVETKTKEQEDEEKSIAEQGKELMKALRDPAKAPIVIKFLAESAGYKKDEVIPTTKAEVKALRDDILDDLKEGLGEEFNIVAERLAPALEKILNKQLEKSQQDIRAKMLEQEQEKLQNQSATVLTTLSQDFFGEPDIPDNVQKAMSSFMDRVSPSPGSSIRDYIEDAFHYSIGKLGLQKTDSKTKARTERARTDASSHLASERAPSESTLKASPKPMTRQEAIEAAIKAVEKEQG
jgi:hypothetical protein